MEEGRAFRVTVAGQYYGVSEVTGTAAIKNYTATFILPSQEAALSVICKHLLPPYLKRNYPDYARFRTHKIVSLECINHTPDRKVLQMAFEDMDVSDLSDFCILRQILIDPYKHSNLEKIREEIKKIWENKVATQKQDKKTGKDKEQKEVADLLALNKLQADEHPEMSAGLQTMVKKKVIKAEVEVAPVGADVDPDPLPPAADEDILA